VADIKYTGDGVCSWPNSPPKKLKVKITIDGNNKTVIAVGDAFAPSAAITLYVFSTESSLCMV
jgi:hypothetical protein